jgi:DnaJ-like protein
MSDRDYYEILGLTPRADGPMVDQAYWHLVRKYQALAATNTRAQHMIDELNEAYGVIGNPRLREQYDAFRDDVLIRAGMIKPVKSKQPQAEKQPKAQAAESKQGHKQKQPKRERNVSLPAVQMPEHWRTYAVSAIIAFLAFAAAWQGVNVVLVVVALACGLGFSLAPTLTRKMSELSFEMPNVAMPDLRMPRVDMPKVAELKIREFGDADREEGIDADTLSRSTRDTIARWRHSVGLKVTEPDEDGEGLIDMRDDVMPPAPDPDADPFGTVMDILRSGAKTTPERTRNSG